MRSKKSLIRRSLAKTTFFIYQKVDYSPERKILRGGLARAIAGAGGDHRADWQTMFL